MHDFDYRFLLQDCLARRRTALPIIMLGLQLLLILFFHLEIGSVQLWLHEVLILFILYMYKAEYSIFYAAKIA